MLTALASLKGSTAAVRSFSTAAATFMSSPTFAKGFRVAGVRCGIKKVPFLFFFSLMM